MINENDEFKNFKKSDLGLVPIEWNLKRLDEIALFKNGINFTKEQKGNDGILTIDVLNMYSDGITIDPTNLYRVKKEINNDFLLKKGDVLIVRSSLKKEGVGWAILFTNGNEDITYCGFIIRVRLKNNDLIPGFLVHFLRSNKARELLISKSDKVAITNINQGMLGGLTVPIPPKLEQKNILYILESVQNSITEAKNVIEQSKNLKNSLLHHLFTYGPVPIDQRETVELQETELGLLPKAWEVKKIKEVAELIMGQSPPGSSYNNVGDGFPFLQGKAEFGRTSPTHIKYTTDPKKIAKKDTVLISVRAPVGDVNLANIDYCIGRGLASISLKDGNNVYLFYTLGFYQELLKKEGTGSTFKAINKSNLSDFLIPYPNLTIQNKMVIILQSLDNKIKAEINKKAALEELFRTLLEKLMTGQIRVNELDLEEIKT